MRIWSGLVLILIIFMTACSSPSEEADPATALPADQDRVEEEQSPEPTTEESEPAEEEETTAEVLSLEELPIVPEVSQNAVDIFNAGVEAGRNPAIFTKVGDCMTENENYLQPIATETYDLAEFDYLTTAIDQYLGVTVREVEGQPVDSFSNPSLSVSCGFNSASPLDPIWADPSMCNEGEPPLACELRVSNASVALIMLGTHDVYFPTDKFEGYLDEIVQTTIDQNVVPVLITFPLRTDKPDETISHNEVIVEVAQEYDIPVANLWLALQNVDNKGIAPDEVTDLSIPVDGCSTCFTEANLNSGIVMQNLVALEALNAIIQAVEEEGTGT